MFRTFALVALLGTAAAVDNKNSVSVAPAPAAGLSGCVGDAAPYTCTAPSCPITCQFSHKCHGDDTSASATVPCKKTGDVQHTGAHNASPQRRMVLTQTKSDTTSSH